MSSLDYIVESIAQKLNKEQDYAFKENVKFSVSHWRATLINRTAARHKLDTNLFQTLCIDLVYDNIDLCCENITGCKGVISKEKIPETINFNKNSPLYKVTTLKFKEINYAPTSDWNNLKHLKYNNKPDVYDVVNNKLFLKDNVNLKYVYIQDIFYDPIEAFSCNNNNKNPCDEENYPITSDLITAIIEGVISLDLKILNNNNRLEIQI